MSPALEVYTAANGQPSARLSEAGSGRAPLALFSAYDPGKEAERFAAAALRGKAPEAIVILGAGLGHLEAAAARLAPRANVCSVVYAAALAPPRAESGWSVWTPAADRPLARFFRDELGDRAADAVEVLEWPASALAFPELSRRARDALLGALKENAYSALTLAAFGRRWLRNALANFLCLGKPVEGNPLRAGLVTVIAAAGPSLAKALPLLERHRGRINLVALASALSALADRGLVPDVAVATDAGYYASLLLSSVRPKTPLLAMPLSAARGAWKTGERVLLFGQPNFFEQEILTRGGLRVPATDAHGTAAGTALLLARAWGAGQIFFGGLDFCHDDIRSHVSPHPYDVLLELGAGRLESAYSRACRRAFESAPRRLGSGRERTSETLAVYAASFEGMTPARTAPVRRLFGSPVDVPGVERAEASQFEAAAERARGGQKSAGLTPVRRYPDIHERRRVVKGLLGDWLDMIERAPGAPAGPLPRPLRELARFFSGRAGRPGNDGATERMDLSAAGEFLRSLRLKFIEEQSRE